MAGLLLPSAPLRAADSIFHNTGNLVGAILNQDGLAEMGATVQLLNRYDRVVAKTLSGPDGKFAFVSLPGDVYSVRVSVPSFIPAFKNKILVEGGFDSVLQIHLASLFSSVEVTYGIPTSAMSDDWKWVLRSSPSTRPVNRYTDDSESAGDAPVFSRTHAMLSVHGGDGGSLDAAGTLPDLGTGFAISTDIYGSNKLRVSAAVGQNASVGPPQMALEATYSHSTPGNLLPVPEITLSVAQVAGIGVPQGGNPFAGLSPLRSYAVSFYNQLDPVDFIHLEYGSRAEAVDYQQHTSRLSPFARVTVHTGAAGEVLAAWSDGGRPDDLLRHLREPSETADLTDVDANSSDLTLAMAGLGRLPAISSRDNRLRMERTRNMELGWRREIGSTTVAASAFQEETTDGFLNLAGDPTGFAQGDILATSWSTTAAANIGNYRRTGYLFSSSSRLNDLFELALAYGSMGAFGVNSDLAGRQLQLTRASSQVAAVNAKTRLPGSGTQITVNYGWTESGLAVPRHSFTTQNMYVAPGLNIWIRQPLPQVFNMPGRIELTANLQNLLAQGYLPLAAASGHPLMIAESPRAIRGGVNFIF